MFSKEMKRAVDSVQQCIKTCSSSDNVAMVVADNINKYLQYVDELDPSDIAFDKTGFFNNMAIKRYWQKVADYYPAMENLIDFLAEKQRVLSNTKNTLDNKLEKFEGVYNEFKASAEENRCDSDYMQQALVADNTYTLLLNTISEYTYLESKVSGIVAISKQVLDAAMLIAQNTYKIKVQSKGTVAGIADITIYKNNFAKLRRVLN